MNSSVRIALSAVDVKRRNVKDEKQVNIKWDEIHLIEKENLRNKIDVTEKGREKRERGETKERKREREGEKERD